MARRLVLMLGLIASLSTTAMAEPPKTMKRVALGSFGAEDYGAWFRLLVEDELLAQGFEVVPLTEKPDATLAGIIIRQNPAEPSAAHYPEGLVRLHLPNGKVIWRYRPTGGMGNHSSPPEAGRLVKALTQFLNSMKTD